MLSNTREEFNRIKNNVRKLLRQSCVNCESTFDLYVHHIVPLNDGGTNRISNLAMLCGDCHSKVHGMRISNISEATKRGLERAKADGRVGGRRRVDTEKLTEAIAMYDSSEYTVPEITEMTGIGKTTLYKYLKERKG